MNPALLNDFFAQHQHLDFAWSSADHRPPPPSRDPLRRVRPGRMEQNDRALRGHRKNPPDPRAGVRRRVHHQFRQRGEGENRGRAVPSSGSRRVAHGRRLGKSRPAKTGIGIGRRRSHPVASSVGGAGSNAQYRLFLDSSGNAMTVVHCFTDIPARGGGTWLCEDAVPGERLLHRYI